MTGHKIQSVFGRNEWNWAKAKVFVGFFGKKIIFVHCYEMWFRWIFINLLSFEPFEISL